MNWPPPPDTPLTFRTEPIDPSPPPRRSEAERRQQTARPLAAWLAISGAVLLMVAAIVVVAGRWEHLSPWLRCALLVASVSIVFVLAERLRPATPVTATVIGHLAPLLVGPAAVAAAATVGSSWRTCILVAGVATIPAAEVQRQRWRLPLLVVGTSAAAGLGLAGVAALVHVPVGVLGGVVAVGLLAAGARRHALALAVMTAAAPALAVLAEVKVGSGTLVELGAVGSRLAWAAPTANLLAAMVIGVHAHRRRSVPWAAAALTAAAFGALAGLASGATPITLWATLPALVLLVLEVMDATPRDRPWFKLAAALPVVREVVGVIGMTLATTLLVWQIDVLPRGWVLPLGATAGAIAFTAYRVRSTQSSLADRALLVALTLTVASAYVLGVPLPWLAIGFLLIAVSITLTATRLPITNSVTSVLSMTLLALRLPGLEWSAWWVVAAITVAGMVLVKGGTEEAFGEPVLVALAVAAPVLAAELATGDRVAGVIAFVAAAAVAARRWPQWSAHLAAAGAVVSILGVAAPWTASVGFGLAALFTFVICRSLAARHLGSAQAVLAAVAAGMAADMSTRQVTLAALLGAIALTGAAFTSGRRTVLDSLAISTSAAALVLSFENVPALASVALIVLGAQMALYGVVRRTEPLCWAGAAVSAGGVISLWWTTALHTRVLETFNRAGITGNDLMVISAGLVLLIVGELISRRTNASSYLTHGPGLVLLGEWLVVAQLRAEGAWIALAAVGAGVAWLALGAWRRLGAPLIAGTALLIFTLLVSSGERLASLPGWVWLLVGGTTLVALAAAVERTGGSSRENARTLVRSLR